MNAAGSSHEPLLDCSSDEDVESQQPKGCLNKCCGGMFGKGGCVRSLFKNVAERATDGACTVADFGKWLWVRSCMGRDKSFYSLCLYTDFFEVVDHS